MPVQPLETRIRRQAGLAIIDMVGDLDGNAEAALGKAYAQAEGQDQAAILLNFAQVAYINSKGIALIVVLLRRAAESGRRLLASGLSDHYREIFGITRLSDYISVFTDEESALTASRPLA